MRNCLHFNIDTLEYYAFLKQDPTSCINYSLPSKGVHFGFEFERLKDFFARFVTLTDTSIITVLYTPGEVRTLYEKVFSLHSTLDIIEEADFHSDMNNIFLKYESAGIKSVLLCVDDLIFIRNVELW